MIKKLYLYLLHDAIYDLDDYNLALIRTVIRGSAQSSTQAFTHGVPQGSVPSPLLSLVFINDLSEGVWQPTTVDIFADDATLSSFWPYTDTS